MTTIKAKLPKILKAWEKHYQKKCWYSYIYYHKIQQILVTDILKSVHSLLESFSAYNMDLNLRFLEKLENAVNFKRHRFYTVGLWNNKNVEMTAETFIARLPTRRWGKLKIARTIFEKTNSLTRSQRMCKSQSKLKSSSLKKSSVRVKMRWSHNWRLRTYTK